MIIPTKDSINDRQITWILLITRKCKLTIRRILMMAKDFSCRRGLFNVPHVAHAYLINGTFLQRFTPTYIDSKIDADLKFSQSIRDAVRRAGRVSFPEIDLSFLFKGYFMFITNEMNYGHLIDPENFNISLTEPELYEVFNNTKVNYSFQS